MSSIKKIQSWLEHKHWINVYFFGLGIGFGIFAFYPVLGAFLMCLYVLLLVLERGKI